MAAGGISYSGLNDFRKVTLPSVEACGNNKHIIRDHHKSITTRRINKVGDDSLIIQQIDDSGDRFCEAIQVYARGINPSVSVSYSNEGNNGGQHGRGIS